MGQHCQIYTIELKNIHLVFPLPPFIVKSLLFTNPKCAKKIT